jgi:soluble lytic murein transglycosylase
MQIKPSTAQWIAKKVGKKWNGPKSLLNPSTNVKLSLAYLSYLRKRFNNDPVKYISAYNMGVTNVNRSIASGGRPRIYSGRVLAHYSEIYRSLLLRSSSQFIAKN